MTIVEIMLSIMVTIISGVSTFLIIANIKSMKQYKADVLNNKRICITLRKDLDTTIQKRKDMNDDNKTEHKMILRYNMAIGKGMIEQGVNGDVKKALDKLEIEVLNLL